MGDEQEVLRILDETGAYRRGGHFRLVSGNDTDTYVHVRLALAYPEHASSLGVNLADHFLGEQIDVVVGFTLGGVKLAEQVAKSLGTKIVLAERTGEEVALVGGYTILEGENVLVVDDILTTGGSIYRVIDLIKKQSKGKIRGVGVVVDRSKEKPDFGVKFASLARIDLNLWPPASCPKCKRGIPLTKLSLPDRTPAKVLKSLRDKEGQNSLLDLMDETYGKWHAESVLDEIQGLRHQRSEIPGMKYERVAVLGAYGMSAMLTAARYIANADYYAVTSKRIYWKGSAKQQRFKPYDHETMNDFLRRMIHSCQYVIVIHGVPGGQLIETAWCAETHKPTLGIVQLKPFESDELGSCEYLLHSSNYKILYCDAFRALRQKALRAGAWLCERQVGCPFLSVDLSKMVIDLFATSGTMFLVGSEEMRDCERVIRSFLVNRGILNPEDLGLASPEV